eukprot:m.164465 g.164465  ORF g.164465 m.164465 type:complete len:213 (+) comp16409_c0_seq2:552-1190(+)
MMSVAGPPARTIAPPESTALIVSAFLTGFIFFFSLLGILCIYGIRLKVRNHRKRKRQMLAAESTTPERETGPRPATLSDVGWNTYVCEPHGATELSAYPAHYTHKRVSTHGPLYDAHEPYARDVEQPLQQSTPQSHQQQQHDEDDDDDPGQPTTSQLRASDSPFGPQYQSSDRNFGQHRSTIMLEPPSSNSTSSSSSPEVAAQETDTEYYSA